MDILNNPLPEWYLTCFRRYLGVHAYVNILCDLS